jgi:hypothetical protein
LRSELLANKADLIASLATPDAPSEDHPDDHPEWLDHVAGWSLPRVREWGALCVELERLGLAIARAGEVAFCHTAAPDPVPLAAALDPAPVPGREPLPPRPVMPPTFGWTRGGHVVALPRTEAEERRDPVRLVTGEGWPDWYPPTHGGLT